jgi:hypothetical protein
MKENTGKNVARLMQFYSGSSKMVPLRLHPFVKLLLNRPWPDDW